jgi:hypothetical protein
MSDWWLQEYLGLAFRLHTLIQATYESPFVEAFYGPPVWQAQAESEPPREASELVQQAIRLVSALPLQGFPSRREQYLGKHLKAMEILGRQLCGETFRLAEQASAYLDIQPAWTPEEQFEQAHTLYKQVLPGMGSLLERLQTYRARLAFPSDQQERIPSLVSLAFTEARRRTCHLAELPTAEALSFEYLTEWDHEAAAYYQGNYHTQITINMAATAQSIARLFDHKVCHEGYPGHHTEYILKEQHLYREQGYIEQAICLTLCPHSVLREGIATLAHEMIFMEGEAEEWIVEHIYRPLHQQVDPVVLLQLRRASQMLGGVWENAALLLDEGRPEAEVRAYCVRFLLISEESARRAVALLKHPIWGPYQLTYTAGQRVLRPWLQGSDKQAVFRRLLMEQWVPSQLLRANRMHVVLPGEGTKESLNEA